MKVAATVWGRDVCMRDSCVESRVARFLFTRHSVFARGHRRYSPRRESVRGLATAIDRCPESPHRSNRKHPTQDRRRLRRYGRRRTVERTSAWFQHDRRLCIRWEESTTMFQRFLHLGCSLMLLKEVFRWVLVDLSALNADFTRQSLDPILQNSLDFARKNGCHEQ